MVICSCTCDSVLYELLHPTAGTSCCIRGGVPGPTSANAVVAGWTSGDPAAVCSVMLRKSLGTKKQLIYFKVIDKR